MEDDKTTTAHPVNPSAMLTFGHSAAKIYSASMMLLFIAYTRLMLPGTWDGWILVSNRIPDLNIQHLKIKA